jgi:hypothetical protein
VPSSVPLSKDALRLVARPTQPPPSAETPLTFSRQDTTDRVAPTNRHRGRVEVRSATSSSCNSPSKDASHPGARGGGRGHSRALMRRQGGRRIAQSAVSRVQPRATAHAQEKGCLSAVVRRRPTTTDESTGLGAAAAAAAAAGSEASAYTSSCKQLSKDALHLSARRASGASSSSTVSAQCDSADS